jgi:hypothetical protein
LVLYPDPPAVVRMTKEEEGRRTQPGVSVRREKGALIQWEEDIRTKCKAALDVAFTNANFAVEPKVGVNDRQRKLTDVR